MLGNVLQCVCVQLSIYSAVKWTCLFFRWGCGMFSHTPLLKHTHTHIYHCSQLHSANHLKVASSVHTLLAWMCLKIWIFYEMLPSAFESAWGFSLMSQFFTWTLLFSPLFHHSCRQVFILKPLLLSLTRFSWSRFSDTFRTSSQRKCRLLLRCCSFIDYET